MRTHHSFLLAIILPCFLYFGCGETDLRNDIIGKWDCTDLNWNMTRARNDAALFTMVFGEDGICVSYWTDTGGSRYMESTNRYSCASGRLQFENENVGFRAKLRGNKLTLIREKSNNAEEHGKSDDVGKRIIFHRFQGSLVAPQTQ